MQTAKFVVFLLTAFSLWSSIMLFAMSIFVWQAEGMLAYGLLMLIFGMLTKLEADHFWF